MQAQLHDTLLGFASVLKLCVKASKLRDCVNELPYAIASIPMDVLRRFCLWISAEVSMDVGCSTLRSLAALCARAPSCARHEELATAIANT